MRTVVMGTLRPSATSRNTRLASVRGAAINCRCSKLVAINRNFSLGMVWASDWAITTSYSGERQV